MRRQPSRKKRRDEDKDKAEKGDVGDVEVVIKKVRTNMSRKGKAPPPKEDIEESSSGSLLSKAEIKKRIDDLVQCNDEEKLEVYFMDLQEDSRVFIATLIAQARKSILQQKEERIRLEIMMEYERAIIASFEKKNKMLKNKRNQQRFYLVGVDEVGVGPLAGPIVSCAVAFEYSMLQSNLIDFVGINDSKKLSAIKRQRLEKVIKLQCTSYNFGIVHAKEVDEINPLQGSFVAMKRAIELLKLPQDSQMTILVDHHIIPNLQDPRMMNQISITKGDSKSIVIAAASILAKVHRDRYMSQLHEQYPLFGFDRNAGYGTKEHLIQLRKGNICPEHRLTYEPVRLAHKKSVGLPPDASVKKTRAKGKTPVKEQTVPLERMIKGEASTTSTFESSVALQPSSILNLAWWTSWLPSFAQSSTS